MGKLVDNKDVFQRFISNLKVLFAEHENVKKEQLGFPDNWIEVLETLY